MPTVHIGSLTAADVPPHLRKDSTVPDTKTTTKATESKTTTSTDAKAADTKAADTTATDTRTANAKSADTKSSATTERTERVEKTFAVEDVDPNTSTTFKQQLKKEGVLDGTHPDRMPKPQISEAQKASLLAERESEKSEAEKAELNYE